MFILANTPGRYVELTHSLPKLDVLTTVPSSWMAREAAAENLLASPAGTMLVFGLAELSSEFSGAGFPSGSFMLPSPSPVFFLLSY